MPQIEADKPTWDQSKVTITTGPGWANGATMAGAVLGGRGLWQIQIYLFQTNAAASFNFVVSDADRTAAVYSTYGAGTNLTVEDAFLLEVSGDPAGSSSQVSIVAGEVQAAGTARAWIRTKFLSR